MCTDLFLSQFYKYDTSTQSHHSSKYYTLGLITEPHFSYTNMMKPKSLCPQPETHSFHTTFLKRAVEEHTNSLQLVVKHLS